MTMDQLKPGQQAIVTEIRLWGTLRRRLQELGLINGTKVYCELIAVSGDPTAYRIRGALIALRSKDTKKILVSLKE